MLPLKKVKGESAVAVHKQKEVASLIPKEYQDLQEVSMSGIQTCYTHTLPHSLLHRNFTESKVAQVETIFYDTPPPQRELEVLQSFIDKNLTWVSFSQQNHI